jgi:hypothetical protein
MDRPAFEQQHRMNVMQQTVRCEVAVLNRMLSYGLSMFDCRHADDQGVIGQIGASGSRCAAAPRSVSVVRGVATAALLLSAAPSMALECPSPQPAGAAGAIQETPVQIAELSHVLASGDLGNRIPVFARSLRNRHPNAATGDLVNYLITAYCPSVNSLTGLSDSEKQARLSAFVSQVVQAAYSQTEG